MKGHLPDFNFRLYAGILQRKRYAALGAALAVLTAFTFLSLFWKSSYVAKSTVFVSSNSAMDTLVKNVNVPDTLDEQLKNLTDSLTSGEMLEGAIEKLNLKGKPGMKVAEVKKRIKVSIKRDKENDQFAVAYSAGDPKECAMFVNTLVNEFITEKSYGKAERAFEFLGSQLAQYKAKLDDYTGQLNKYEKSHPGAYPMPQTGAYQDLISLQTMQNASELKLSDLIAKRQSLMERLSENPETFSQDAPASSPQGTLNALNARLTELRGRYTENYPEVQKVEDEIRELRQKIAKEDKSGQAGYGNPSYNRLKADLKETNSEIAYVRAMVDRISGQIQQSARVSAGSQQMEWLQSQMETYQKTYDDLQQKYEAARLAKNLALSAAGTNFRVEPAVPPKYPAQPDKLMLLALGLLAALISGIALVFGMEYYDDSFKNETDLAGAFGLHAMASIPEIVTAETKVVQKKRDKRIFAAAGAYMFLFGIVLLNEALAKFAGMKLFNF